MQPTVKDSLLDTNVLLRFLLGDDPRRSPRAAALLQRLAMRQESAILEDSVLAETVWMLDKGFGVARDQIVRQLTTVVLAAGIRCRGKSSVLEALGLFATTNCDIVDCLLAARARRRKAKVLSFDADFKKLGCAWEEPR